MSERKKKDPRAPAVPVTVPTPVSSARRRFGAREALAVSSALLCLALAWASRAALNPDGVSYLDLARLARIGDWKGFVQGYWSPLFPALIAALSPLAASRPLAQIGLAHLVNGMAAVSGVTLAWWWGRQDPSALPTRGLLATFLLASTGLPRIEAVTPDVLLLTLFLWIGYELVHHRESRPVLSGLALGLGFLAKTSVWPWLLCSLPLRLWGASAGGERRKVLGSFVVTLIVASTWIIPLSIETGHLTTGSAGRLNYDWYIASSDARTPDTHTGRHRAYHTIAVDSVHQVEFVELPESDRWTYAPWSDPTAWQAGIESSNATAPEVGELLAYWGRQARRTFGFWMLPVLLGVLLPFGLVFWRPGLTSRLFEQDRPILVGILLGLAGVLQFIIVHAEPRLLAPFVLLLGLSVLQLLSAGPTPPRALRPLHRRLATAVGWLVVLWLSVLRFRAGKGTEEHARQLLATRPFGSSESRPMSAPRDRIVVAGPAMPIAPAAFLLGAHIVAQMPPSSLSVAQGLSPERQLSLLKELFAGKAEIAWVSDWSGAVQVVQIPPR